MRVSRPYSSGDGETMSEGFSSGLDLGDASAGLGGGDLQQTIAAQQQQMQIMEQLHHLNATCFDTCITGSFSSSLSGREETCMTNCVERFVDTTLLITNRFAQLAQKMGAR